MNDPVPNGGEPLVVAVASPERHWKARNWKARILDWIFAQGSIAVVLIAWLGWTIYDGNLKEVARIQAATARQEWEQKLADRIDARFTLVIGDFKAAIRDISSDNQKTVDRYESRFDRLLDRLKGP